jgi:uncharacterized protein (TIGR00290 family)
MRKTMVCWSSGKDSAWTLHALRQSPEYEVVALLTTITRDYDRVSMHGVRRQLVEAQAAAAGLPLWPVEIPAGCINAQYEEAMGNAVRRAVADGIELIAFGDLFLRDIREYREQRLAGSGMQPIFPLWERDTRELANEMIAGGLRARLTCLDPRALSPHFAGREFDRALLDELPAGVDPCGERGEFHTFAYAGPMFRSAISLTLGDIVQRDGFVFADLCDS